MSKKQKLLPCPLCGREPDVETTFYAHTIVACVNDDCPEWPFEIRDSKSEAIAAWNTRAKTNE